jgi:hypothetical protein
MSDNAFWRRATLAFASGALGGLANRIFVWLIGALGITAALGVKISPPLAKEWIYSGIVWGGLWGFVFLIPWRQSWWVRGLAADVATSLVLMVYFFAQNPNVGLFGLGLGGLTPVVVLVANGVWGLLAAYWYDCVLSKETATA